MKAHLRIFSIVAGPVRVLILMEMQQMKNKKEKKIKRENHGEFAPFCFSFSAKFPANASRCYLMWFTIGSNSWRDHASLLWLALPGNRNARIKFYFCIHLFAWRWWDITVVPAHSSEFFHCQKVFWHRARALAIRVKTLTVLNGGEEFFPISFRFFVAFFHETDPFSSSRDRNFTMTISKKPTGRGAFIVLEGLDRSGKTTQSQKLVEGLLKHDVPTEFMRFPGKKSELTFAFSIFICRVDLLTDRNPENPLSKMISDYLSSKAELDPITAHLLFSAQRTQERYVVQWSIDWLICYMLGSANQSINRSTV